MAPLSRCRQRLLWSRNQLAKGKRAWIGEVAGQRWIGANAFSKVRGVRCPDEAFDSRGGFEGTLVDAYAGVSTSATVGRTAVIAIERGSTRSPTHRLSGRRQDHQAGVERWRPSIAPVIVADPARRGLGAGSEGAV